MAPSHGAPDDNINQPNAKLSMQYAIPLTDMFQIDTTGRTRLNVGATRILESISSLIEWCPSGICWIMIL